MVWYHITLITCALHSNVGLALDSLLFSAEKTQKSAADCLLRFGEGENGDGKRTNSAPGFGGDATAVH